MELEPTSTSSKLFYVLNSVQYSMFIYLFNTKIKNQAFITVGLLTESKFFI